MTHSIEHPVAMLPEELDAVRGGMKTDPNYVSKNVIDARGGSLTVWGVTFTYDINGKMSSIT